MTDNDIIKALECCGNQMYSCTDKSCKAKTLGEALDLINRQKEEISKKDIEIDILIRKKEDLSDEVSDLRAEVERLQTENKKLKRDMSYMSSPNTIGDRHEMGCW